VHRGCAGRPEALDLERDIAWGHVVREDAGATLDALREQFQQMIAAGVVDDRADDRFEAKSLALYDQISILSERLSAVKERRHRILHGHSVAITSATVDELLRGWIIVLDEFVPSDKRDACRAALVRRLGRIPRPAV
jgi:hypothetical protein